MIHYRLRCGAAHEFDAWFRDSAAYGEQAARGLLECPDCGETNVTRALMAPAVPRRKRGTRPLAPPVDEPTPPTSQQVAVQGDRLPAQMRAALQRLRAEVEQRCEYVGNSFADEARRIHDGDSEARGIYGETTPEQARALADDGIEVSQIPWLPPADA